MGIHTKRVNQSFSILETDSSGLSSAEALEREKKYGMNILPLEPDITLFGHFLQQFKSPIIYILLLAALMAMVIQEYTDAGFILLVLLLNAAIGTYNEYSASQPVTLELWFTLALSLVVVMEADKWVMFRKQKELL